MLNQENKSVTINTSGVDMDKLLLTNSKGDTYTSKSEELMGFILSTEESDPSSELTKLRVENERLKEGIEKSRIQGVLTGLKICKEMWAQGTISHENIYENEVLYKEELESLTRKEK